MPGRSTPSNFLFGGGYFLMGITTGFDYTVKRKADKFIWLIAVHTKSRNDRP